MDPHIPGNWVFDDATELAVLNRLRKRQIQVEEFGVDLAESETWKIASGTGTIENISGRSVNKLATGASKNDAATLMRKDSSRPYDTEKGVIRQQFELKIDTADEDKLFGIFGLGSSAPVPTSGVPAEGIFVGIVSGVSATNFVGISSKGGSQATVDLGVALDTSFHEFRIVARKTQVEFWIDGVKAGEVTDTDKIPVADFCEIFHVETLEASAHNFQIDFSAVAAGRA